jgi:flagellar basal-body rod modification protein FlgD
VTTVNSATSAGATTSANASPASAAFDKDTFMKLLVAQLKYQNPMAPADNNEYMNQMATFAQVEKLGQLVSSQQAAQAWQERLSAEALVGKQVTGTDSHDASHTATVTSVDFGDGSPTLTLSDGSTLALGSVTTVAQAPPTALPPPAPTQ